MAGPNDFTGQNIQDTYQRVLQISSSGQITDGTGSLVPLLEVTASFAVSASHEITFEVSSSHAQTASISDKLNIASDGANRVIIADGDGTVTAASNFTYDGALLEIEAESTNLRSPSTGFNLTGNITASGNISASGTVHALRYIDTTAGVNINSIYSTIASPIFTGAITASGNISSSGTIAAQNFLLGSVGAIKVKDTNGNTDDTAVINLADTAITFGDTDMQTLVQGNIVVLDAAGDVRIDSATGLIRFQDSTIDSIVFNAQNGVGQITASGNISSSGEIIGIINGGTF